MIQNDKQAIEIIKTLIKADFKNEDEFSRYLNLIEDYQLGVSDEIYYCKPGDSMEPEDILARAREKNKPIILGDQSSNK